MNAIRNSWQLVKASAAVLSKDRELLIFPILSSIGLIIVTASFALPMFFAGMFDNLVSEKLPLAVYLITFLFYIVQYTVVFFCNTALVGAAMIRLDGGDPSVGDGFRIAFSRLGAIVGYAVIAATVGMILRTISEKSKGLGRFVISLIGFAWNVATFLVVPVLAVEGVGPFEAIKRSVLYLRKTWGEQLAGNFGLSAFFGIIVLVIILIGVPLIILAAYYQSILLGAITIALMVLLFMVIGLIQASLTGIYTAAVYQFAAHGKTTGFFDQGMVQNAFKIKQEN
jgi:hypothetical protein